MSDVAARPFSIDQIPAAVEQPAAATASSVRARLSMLVISPFSPLPQDAGQRKRVHQMLQVLKELGFSVTLLLHPFEGAWLWRYQDDAAEQLRTLCDEVVILPAPRMVGEPPRSSDHHALDEWWDEVLENFLGRLFGIRHFDAVLVNNVWLSKALTLAPPQVAKVIDMHDLFHLREAVYATSGIVPEFFRISERDELFGLRRADICISISLPEARYLAGVLDAAKVVYLPYQPHPNAPAGPADRRRPDDYLHPEKVIFGFIGISHGFNVAGVVALLDELYQIVAQNFAPIDLLFAGTICDKLDAFADRIHMTRLGWIPEEEEFYDRIDFAIVPVFCGTGFKIKVADTLERRKPALFSEHSVEGLPVDETLVAADARAMAGMMSQIAFSRPPLAVCVDLIDKSRQQLSSQVHFGTNSLMSSLDQCFVECILDLRGLHEIRKILALLSATAAARELKDHVRMRLLVDSLEPWLEPAVRYLPPSVGIERRSCAMAATSADAAHRLYWQFGDGRDGVELLGNDMIDLRFAEWVAPGGIPAEIVVAPNQVRALDGLTGVDWCCLPYLTDSIRWDPAARALVATCRQQFPVRASGDPLDVNRARTFVTVDSEHAFDAIQSLMARHLDSEVTICDLRRDRDLAGLLVTLHGVVNKPKHRLRVLDGCTGASPFQHLVLEMALLCGVPFATSAFGPFQQVAGDTLEQWRMRKSREDQAAFQGLARGFDSMRGSSGQP